MMIRVQANILAVLVSALSVASIFMTHTLFTVVKNVQFETRIMKKEYSMLGDDWPPFSPLKLERKVEMVVEESVHYVAGGLGGGTGKAEWQYQRGFGYDGAARLGPDNRTFAVSLFHQEHCLLYLHAQLSDRTKDDESGGRFAHHQHCLNYLRQQALCHPDLTLEQGDFAAATRDFEVGRVGQTHVCRDFDTAWDYNTERWLEWYRFLKDSRIPTTPRLEFD